MIRFGAWSTTLGLAAAFGTLIAVLLLIAPKHRVANRLLAALLVVSVLRLMPYVIGFAGFYDAYPWLTFAPFDFRLAEGPLLYLYVRRRVTPRLPDRWLWHLVPALVVFVYTAWAFAMPLADKHRWNDAVHVRWIDPIESAAALLSLAVYLVMTFRFRRSYSAWLAEHVSDRDAHRQPWLTTVMVALALSLVASAGFETVDRLVVPLSYFDRFPLYLVFSVLLLWLGLEGWRHADHAFPMMSPEVVSIEPPAESIPARTRDWQSMAAVWHQRLRTEGWSREPGLTLADVARRLGTNATYVSRAFNVGLGQNFNAVVNGLRIDAIRARLAAGDPGELLTIALDEGFSSKASFNRLFREHAGMSPSAWRAAHLQEIATNPGYGTTAPTPAA
jgi:AraC-like DNA-binding protein